MRPSQLETPIAKPARPNGVLAFVHVGDLHLGTRLDPNRNGDKILSSAS